MKIFALLFTAVTLCFVPAFGQIGIISTDAKLSALEKEGKFDEAIADINERIQIQPDNGELYLRRAQFLKLQNKLDEAIDDISKGIKTNPDNPTFYIARAEYFNLAKNNNAVLKDVQTAASLAPNKSGILIYGALELKRRENYEEIINLADFYLARNSANDDVSNRIKHYSYKIRGESKFALKDYAGALEDSIAAINSITFTGDFINDSASGIALSDMLKSEVILQTTKNYLKDDERIFDYYNQLFDALEKRIEISIEEITQFTNGELKKQGKPPMLEADFISFPQVGCLEELMFDCIQLYIKKNQIEKANELFGRFTKLNLPNKADRYDKRADFYVKLKKYQAAINDLTSIVSAEESTPLHHPRYILYLNKRGRLYENTNQFDKAVADYEKIKTISPRDEKSMNEMIINARQKQMENANQPK